ncbi:MAG: hypothetical protein KAR79_05465 [Simkaniaceae bacterium]|nr:hypothetical protein [Simkaniaceae bacterium]
MAIYNIFEKEEEYQAPEHQLTELSPKIQEETQEKKSSLFSGEHFFATICARLFFFMLMLLDLCWGVFNVVRLIVFSSVCLLTGMRIAYTKTLLSKAYLNFKRSLVCAVALLVAIICPALGVMFACSYFLMYDKEGIDEVVPSVLRSQFKEFFTN